MGEYCEPTLRSLNVDALAHGRLPEIFQGFRLIAWRAFTMEVGATQLK